ncbi:MAG TPA: hypothetical protein VM101_13515 [Flavitalea sp.]|nr:hypothetical protein [Flavitalea sp.]
MSQNENDKLDRLLQRFDDHAKETKDELATIKRGIYGDKPNGVVGLIETDKDQEKRISALEDGQKKQIWTIGGFASAFSVLGAFIWYLAKELWANISK